MQQGDLLDISIFYFYVLHHLIHKIIYNFKLLVYAWYLDDGAVGGDLVEVAKTIDIIRGMSPRLGLKINIRKTKKFWPLCDGSKHCGGCLLRTFGYKCCG